MLFDRLANINWLGMPYREENEWLLACYMDIGLRPMNEIRNEAAKWRQCIRKKYLDSVKAWESGHSSLKPRSWDEVIHRGIDGQVYLQGDYSSKTKAIVMALYEDQRQNESQKAPVSAKTHSLGLGDDRISPFTIGPTKIVGTKETVFIGFTVLKQHQNTNLQVAS